MDLDEEVERPKSLTDKKKKAAEKEVSDKINQMLEERDDGEKAVQQTETVYPDAPPSLSIDISYAKLMKSAFAVVKFKELFAKDMKAALGKKNFSIVPDAISKGVTGGDTVITYLVNTGGKKFDAIKKIQGKKIKLTNLSKDPLLQKYGAAPPAEIKATFVDSDGLNLGGRMKGGSIAWIDGCEFDDDSTQADYFELLTEEDLNEFTDLELGLLDLVLRTKGGGGAKKGKKGGKKKGGGDDGGDDADYGANDGGATSGSGSKSVKGRLSDWLDGKKEELAAVIENPHD
eukprot:COSAG01_NODE_5255_length_4381_cov_301.360813_1_plen_287_part_10